MISWEINFPINLITLSTSVHIYLKFMRWMKIVANSWFYYMSYEIWLRGFLNLMWSPIYCFKPNEIFLKYDGSYYFLQDLNKTTFSCGTIIPYNLCLYSKNLPWEVRLLSPASQDRVKYNKYLYLCLIGYLANCQERN